MELRNEIKMFFCPKARLNIKSDLRSAKTWSFKLIIIVLKFNYFAEIALLEGEYRNNNREKIKK